MMFLVVLLSFLDIESVSHPLSLQFPKIVMNGKQSLKINKVSDSRYSLEENPINFVKIF